MYRSGRSHARSELEETGLQRGRQEPAPISGVEASIPKKKEGENGFGISAKEIYPISESFERPLSLKQLDFLCSIVSCLFVFVLLWLFLRLYCQEVVGL